MNDYSKDKKEKLFRKCVIKVKLKFENYKNSLQATQLENKVSYIGKNKMNLDSLKKIISNS